MLLTAAAAVLVLVAVRVHDRSPEAPHLEKTAPDELKKTNAIPHREANSPTRQPHQAPARV